MEPDCKSGLSFHSSKTFTRVGQQGRNNRAFIFLERIKATYASASQKTHTRVMGGP